MKNRSGGDGDGTILFPSAKCRCRRAQIYLFLRKPQPFDKMLSSSGGITHTQRCNKYKNTFGSGKNIPIGDNRTHSFFFFILIVVVVVLNMKWHIKSSFARSRNLYTHIIVSSLFSFSQSKRHGREWVSKSQSIFYTRQRRYTLSICRVAAVLCWVAMSIFSKSCTSFTSLKCESVSDLD